MISIEVLESASGTADASVRIAVLGAMGRRRNPSSLAFSPQACPQ